MENKTFNILFDTVSAKLPFSYGILANSETNDPNKAKMKKRNLKNALKTYVWGSYKPLDFDEWRAAHGYSREWCTGNGIYINGLYSGVSHKKKISKDLLPETYEQYKTNFYWEHKKCNEKIADIQTFNCIADLLAENERLKKRNNELEIQNLQTTRNWFNDLHNTNSKLSNILKQ